MKTTSVRAQAEFRDGFTTAFDSLAGADVYYAGKAFLCTAVARWVAEEGLHLDVCTGGELAVAQRVGFPGRRIGFHGNNKTTDEIREALSYGVGRIVVDSFHEIDRIASVAADLGVVAPVMVRVTVGVEAHTHEFIATGHEDQKFGFSLAGGQAFEAATRLLARPDVFDLRGLHSHIGSQIFDTGGFEMAARRLVGLHARVADELGHHCPEIDLGGGYGIAYTSQHTPLTVATLAQEMADIVGRELKAVGDGDNTRVPRVSVEPGPRDRGPQHVHALRGGHRQGRRGRGRALPHLRLGRRRDERQRPTRALRGRLLVHPGQPPLDRRSRACRASSGGTARAATSSCSTSTSRPTSCPATSSPFPAPAPTAAACPASTTTPRDRPSSQCVEAAAASSCAVRPSRTCSPSTWRTREDPQRGDGPHHGARNRCTPARRAARLRCRGLGRRDPARRERRRPRRPGRREARARGHRRAPPAAPPPRRAGRPGPVHRRRRGARHPGRHRHRGDRRSRARPQPDPARDAARRLGRLRQQGPARRGRPDALRRRRRARRRPLLRGGRGRRHPDPAPDPRVAGRRRRAPGARHRQRHHQLRARQDGHHRRRFRRDRRAGAGPRLRRGRPDRRRRGLRRRRQGRDPGQPGLPHPGVVARRAPRGHHRGDGRRHPGRRRDGLRRQAARHLRAGHRCRRRCGRQRAGAPRDDPAQPPARQRPRGLQRGVRRGGRRRRADVLRARSGRRPDGIRRAGRRRRGGAPQGRRRTRPGGVRLRRPPGRRHGPVADEVPHQPRRGRPPGRARAGRRGLRRARRVDRDGAPAGGPRRRRARQAHRRHPPSHGCRPRGHRRRPRRRSTPSTTSRRSCAWKEPEPWRTSGAE